MSKLLATFQERFGDWLTALGQHLQLSLLTLLLAIFSGCPSGYLFRYTQESQQLGFTGGWDLPDHSFHGPLGLFIPIMGIGTLPALTALVIYAISPSSKIPSPVCRGLTQVLKKRESPLG